ncbi:hypothetical protein N431DRAFT_483689 [Stipitochalara longipes BDJ]|nr:hypothetical protein N431DRAFT_483689 [Stipitochalara longipes BDJ]
MPGNNSQRRITYRPRVTTGCFTCKVRKVKCDEGSPYCQKCFKTGRKCDGYARTERTTSNQQPSDSLNNVSLSVDIQGSDQEIRSFQFFKSYTVPQLCGLFESSFWNRLVLQATHHQPAIRHAAIALGSMHEELESNLSAEDARLGKDFTMQQYLKAIRCLIQPMQGQASQNADLALMTCVLFVCFETLRGHHASALSHINGAIKILAELQSGTDSSRRFWTMSPYSCVPLTTLNLIFGRLESQMLLVNGTSRALYGDEVDDKETGYQDHIPNAFSSLGQARNSLDHVWTAHVRYIRKFLPQFESTGTSRLALVDRSKRIAAEKLIKWSEAFECFLRSNRQNFDNASQMTIHVLKAQRIMAGVIFSIEHTTWTYSEMYWDSYFLEYEAIIRHSASFVKLESQLLKSKGVKSTFSLDSGIMIPLLMVANRCRHKIVRRQAISILKSTPRQEGAMSSILTARITERLMEIEENGFPNAQFAEDIPNSARVANVHLDFETERRRVLVTYEKWKKPGTAQGETITDYVEW